MQARPNRMCAFSLSSALTQNAHGAAAPAVAAPAEPDPWPFRMFPSGCAWDRSEWVDPAVAQGNGRAFRLQVRRTLQTYYMARGATHIHRHFAMVRPPWGWNKILRKQYPKQFLLLALVTGPASSMHRSDKMKKYRLQMLCQTNLRFWARKI